MTPSAIEVLLHYYTQSFVSHPRHDAPAVKDARERLLRIGAIEPCRVSGGYIYSYAADTKFEDISKVTTFMTTERGKKWVEALCHTTCPPLHQEKQPA